MRSDFAAQCNRDRYGLRYALDNGWLPPGLAWSYESPCARRGRCNVGVRNLLGLPLKLQPSTSLFSDRHDKRTHRNNGRSELAYSERFGTMINFLFTNSSRPSTDSSFP